MTLLDEIIAYKRDLIPQSASAVSRVSATAAARRSLRKSLLSRPGISLIAEFKRRSPSAGQLGAGIPIESVVCGYERAGAAGISILTDQRYFGGSLADLQVARNMSSLPVLRKDFIVDISQIDESAEAGADAVLLIARVLRCQELQACRKRAAELGLEVIVEVQSPVEVSTALSVEPEIIGVNNRNLESLQIDLSTSFRLAPLLRNHPCVISESGIRSLDTLTQLHHAGFRGFLVGEHLLRAGTPEQAVREMVLERSL